MGGARRWSGPGLLLLLHALASTPAGRDQLLRGYFEADEDDRENGRKLPTAAHHAIADLVARGMVRVILTTNFDRLLERALESRGIQPQVIHRPEQISSMTPLPDSTVTIIKLHGDYADLDKRNTVDELACYPAAQSSLLRRVLDEYGLIMCGWSGEWDVALVQALEETRSRRYPPFWASYGEPTEAAARLIAQCGAVNLPGVSADELFTGLVERLEALDRLAAPPLSRELTVARLKKHLADPVRRIELHHLVVEEVKRLEALAGDRDRYPTHLPGLSDEEFAGRLDDTVRRYREDGDTLLHLLAAGAYHGGSEHDGLWTTVVQRLLSLKRLPGGMFNAILVNLQHYPLLLSVTTMVAAASLSSRDDLLGPVLLNPRFKLSTMAAEEPAAYAIHPWQVFERDEANALPRWHRGPTDGKYYFAGSHLVRADLDDVLAVYEPDPDRRSQALDRAEYLTALAQVAAGGRPGMGEFVLRSRHREEPTPVARGRPRGSHRQPRFGPTALAVRGRLCEGQVGARSTGRAGSRCRIADLVSHYLSDYRRTVLRHGRCRPSRARLPQERPAPPARPRRCLGGRLGGKTDDGRRSRTLSDAQRRSFLCPPEHVA